MQGHTDTDKKGKREYGKKVIDLITFLIRQVFVHSFNNNNCLIGNHKDLNHFNVCELELGLRVWHVRMASA